MADNVSLPVSGTGATGPVPVATEDIGGVQYQRVKLVDGTVTSTAGIPGSVADGLLVNLGSNNDVTVTGTVTANAGTGVVDVTPAAPVATDYLPVRLTDGAAFYVASGGGGGGTSLTDEGVFTEATTAFTPIGGVFNDALTSDPTAGQAAAARITSDRALHVNLRNSSGVEIGGPPLGTANLSDIAFGLRFTRQDTLSNDGSATGEYVRGKGDAFGRLHVNPQGSAGEGAASTQPPVQVGLKAYSADPPALSTSTVVKPLASLVGKQVVLPYALPGQTWNYAPPTGGLVNTTGVAAKAAAGVGIRNYVVSAQIINSHQTTPTEIEIRDGALGTVLWRGFAQAAGGGVSAKFDPPLRGTANTLVEIAEVTATATNGVLVNLSGFTAAE